jgi:hypothetical protein
MQLCRERMKGRNESITILEVRSNPSVLSLLVAQASVLDAGTSVFSLPLDTSAPVAAYTI